jgi:hypothetical protein
LLFHVLRLPARRGYQYRRRRSARFCISKTPGAFEIDLLLCVFWWLPVSAASSSCDAIRMDTPAKRSRLQATTRVDFFFVVNKESLMDWKPTEYPWMILQSS